MTFKSKVGISLPMLNQPHDRIPQLAKLADNSGFYSVWDYEFFRNPFITHALNSQVTERVKLATGIATAAGRTPFEMANAAADIDELSGGRALIGTSVGGVGWTDVYNGADISRPLTRMREYIECMHAIWDHFATGEPFAYDGNLLQAASPVVNPWGVRQMVRPRVPIYLGAVRPGMLRLAGELADGVLGFLQTPEYIEDRVRPFIAEGAAKVGRDAAEVEVTSLVLTAVSEDREMARRIARINVGNYTAYPVSWEAVEHAGLTEDRDAVLEAYMLEGPAGLERATSDALLDAFAICGTPDEAMEQFARWDGKVDHIVLHTPYVPPIAGEDSASSFEAVCRTFADALSG